jgi:hypothetical protein
MCFDPWNRALNFRESRRTPKFHFRECEWRPHNSLKVGLQHNDVEVYVGLPAIEIKSLKLRILDETCYIYISLLNLGWLKHTLLSPWWSSM